MKKLTMAQRLSLPVSGCATCTSTLNTILTCSTSKRPSVLQGKAANVITRLVTIRELADFSSSRSTETELAPPNSANFSSTQIPRQLYAAFTEQPHPRRSPRERRDQLRNRVLRLMRIRAYLECWRVTSQVCVVGTIV
jgi:hypothetical protein